MCPTIDGMNISATEWYNKEVVHLLLLWGLSKKLKLKDIL